MSAGRGAPEPAPRSATGFIATCVVIAAALFVYASFSASGRDPRDRIGLAGVPLGLFVLYLAYAAHRRAAKTQDAGLAPGARPPAALRANELYTLFETAQPAFRLGAWWRNTGPYQEVVGFTSLGSPFLRNPGDGTYVVLWPFRAGRNASTVGKFASIEDFETRFLEDPEAAKVVLEPDRVATIRQSLGPLQPGQVYVPVPILMVLGDKPPKGYQRGDFWTFMDLCGQTHELLQ